MTTQNVSKSQKSKKILMIVGVWFLALVLGAIAVNNPKSLGILYLGFVAAYCATIYILKGKFEFNILNILGLIFFGYVSIGGLMSAIKDVDHPKPSFDILSSKTDIIDGSGYNLKLVLKNTQNLNINGKDFLITGENFETLIPLENQTGEISILAKNQNGEKSEKFSISRKPNTQEQAKIDEQNKQKAEQEKLAQEAKKSEDLKKEQKNNPKKFIEVAEYNWNREGFGTVAVFDITLKNNSQFDYKDINLKATYYGNSETRLGSSNKTIYEVLPAGTSKTFKQVNFGFFDSQTATSNLEVIGASIKQ